MFNLFFNPITHSVSNLLMFSAMVYGLVLVVLGYFKKKTWMERILPAFISNDDSWGFWSFIGIVFGLFAVMDSFIPYPSDNEVFASTLVMYGIVLLNVLIFIIVFFIQLHKSLPEE